jgi:hypothetical protein
MSLKKKSLTNSQSRRGSARRPKYFFVFPAHEMMRKEFVVLFLLIRLARMEGLPHLPEARTSPAHPHASMPSLTLSLRGGSPVWGRRQRARPLITQESEGAAAAVPKAEKDSNAGCMGTLSVVFYLLTSLTLTLMNKIIFTEVLVDCFKFTTHDLHISAAMSLAYD